MKEGNLMYLYLASYKKNNSGVSKKITGQIDAFSMKHPVWYFVEEDSKLFLRKKYEVQILEDIFCMSMSGNKLIRDVALWSNYKKFLRLHKEKLGDFKFVYYRMTPSNPGLVKIMGYLKTQYDTTIVKEIPTYPYAQELKSLGKAGYLKYLIDKTFKRRENNFVDYIATFGDESIIDGIPVISIDNSVVGKLVNESFEMKRDEKISSSRVTRFGMVTAVEYWQGVDRIFHGIANYCHTNDRNIHFDLVGDGADMDRLKALALDLKINDLVTFNGFMSGDKLEEMYEQFDICIGPMGLFRKNLEFVSSLKTKEYLLHFKPFVYSGVERHMQDFKYALKVSNDETPLDFNLILEYFNTTLGNNKKSDDFEYLISTYFTWDRQVENILSRIERGM